MHDACAHCGLLLGRRVLEARVGGSLGRYCCFGCVLAQQVTRARGDDGRAAAVLVRLGVAVFFAMNVMMVTMPSYVPAIYGGEGTSTDGPLFVVLRWLAMTFAGPVLVLLGGPILAAAWQAARHGVVTADALVVLGTIAAYGLSVVNTVGGRPGVYYDTATMLLVLVTLGRYLDARARAEAGALVRGMLAQGVARARRERPGGRVEEIGPELLEPGDVVVVTPGDTFPTDGGVLSGEGGVNEAAISGEALPVVKRAGDLVVGGACSVDGTFRVRVTTVAAESMPARLATLVEAALRARTRAEQVADRVAAVLVPTVVVVALAAGIWWARAESVDRGVLVGLAVLVVACPCGLGLATPLAMWTGVVTAARHGVVVRSGLVLEQVARVRTVLFDKTGTLTSVLPRLARVEPAARRDEILAVAAGLEAGLSHPIARGVVAAARTLRVTPARVASVEVVPGRGVRGVLGGRVVAAGSPGWIAASEAVVRPSTDGDGSAIVVVEDGRLLGVLWFDEALADGVVGAVRALRGLGLSLGVLSGDVRATVLGDLFAAREVAVDLRPEDKAAGVRRARGSGIVAMVGDGLNDAPALAAADVGIAVNGATDLTRTTADVVVRDGGLGQVAWLVAHARRVVRVAKQNLAWAFGYNAIAVVLAALGRLDPVVAAFAMLASSLAVVANARRIAAGEKRPQSVMEVAQVLPRAA